MTDTPLNPDAIDKMKVAVSEVISETTYSCSRVWEAWHYGTMTDEDFEPAWENDTLLTEVVEAVLAVAQPVVNSVEVIPAKMRMLAWEGGEIEVGEIPEGHVLVGFEMATDRAWSMADKVTIHIERKAATNGR